MLQETTVKPYVDAATNAETDAETDAEVDAEVDAGGEAGAEVTHGHRLPDPCIWLLMRVQLALKKNNSHAWLIIKC